MRLLLVRCALAVLATTMASFAAAAQDETAAADPPVARVNGETILRSEVMAAARNLPAQYQAQLALVFPLLVERLVDMKLLALAASDAGLADDAEVARRLAKQRESIMREVFIERLVEERVTDDAVKAQYEVYLEENPPKDEVNARHILVENEADARKVIADLDAGADFEELAKERSKGPSSAQGGDLGYFTAGDMVPEFSEAAFALDPGKHSTDPVQTQFGWHVIKVEDRRTQAAPPFEQLEEQLRDQLAEKAVGDEVGALREKASIEVIGGAAAQSDSGGDAQQ